MLPIVKTIKRCKVTHLESRKRSAALQVEARQYELFWSATCDRCHNFDMLYWTPQRKGCQFHSDPDKPTNNGYVNLGLLLLYNQLQLLDNAGTLFHCLIFIRFAYFQIRASVYEIVG